MDVIAAHHQQTIRTTLEQELQRLNERIAGLTAQDPFSDPERSNDNAASDTEAGEEAGHDRLSALREELEQHRREVTAAIAAIAAGTYGICSSCQSPIETERLLANPTTGLCLSCERQQEQRS